jgi:hypothetical protein
MRVADSQRIKAMKLLTYDSSKDRFANARKLYVKAIDNYNESIMYDDAGNPMVYHKLGFAQLLLDPPDIGNAEQAFLRGIRIKRGAIDQAIQAQKEKDAAKSGGGGGGDVTSGRGDQKQSLDEGDPSKPKGDGKPKGPAAEARTEEEVKVDTELAFAEGYAKKDEDHALMQCGMGLCRFIRGIRDKREEDFRVAIKYFKLADRYSSHPNYYKKAGWTQKVLASFDLEEIVQPTPHNVLQARVHVYQAQKLQEKGQDALADSLLANAQDALDAIKLFYEKEPRFLAEQAQIHLLKKDHAKVLSCLGEIKSTQGYADLKVTHTLKARALIATGKYDEALAVVTEQLLDRDPEDQGAMLMRAAIHASRKPPQYQETKADLDEVFSKPANKENPFLLMEAGDIYFAMGEAERESAKRYYIQAYYIMPKDIRVNYKLGKAYQALGDTANMKICYERACKIDSTASFCKEVAALIESGPRP